MYLGGVKDCLHRSYNSVAFDVVSPLFPGHTRHILVACPSCQGHEGADSGDLDHLSAEASSWVGHSEGEGVHSKYI